MSFEWNESKNAENIKKHGLSFYEAQSAFVDKQRIIYPDKNHSSVEKRFFCVGRTHGGNIATVRFTIRKDNIRIFGAGYWREGKKLYEQQ